MQWIYSLRNAVIVVRAQSAPGSARTASENQSDWFHMSSSSLLTWEWSKARHRRARATERKMRTSAREFQEEKEMESESIWYVCDSVFISPSDSLISLRKTNFNFFRDTLRPVAHVEHTRFFSTSSACSTWDPLLHSFADRCRWTLFSSYHAQFL